MAKFRRFDPRNKKANTHKRRAKDGDFKRMKQVEKQGDYDDEKIVQPQGG